MLGQDLERTGLFWTIGGKIPMQINWIRRFTGVRYVRDCAPTHKSQKWRHKNQIDEHFVNCRLNIVVNSSNIATRIHFATVLQSNLFTSRFLPFNCSQFIFIDWIREKKGRYLSIKLFRNYLLHFNWMRITGTPLPRSVHPSGGGDDDNSLMNDNFWFLHWMLLYFDDCDSIFYSKFSRLQKSFEWFEWAPEPILYNKFNREKT